MPSAFVTRNFSSSFLGGEGVTVRRAVSKPREANALVSFSAAYVALFTLPKVYETYKVSDSVGFCVGCSLEGAHLHAPSSRNVQCGCCCWELCAGQTRIVGLCGS